MSCLPRTCAHGGPRLCRLPVSLSPPSVPLVCPPRGSVASATVPPPPEVFPKYPTAPLPAQTLPLQDFNLNAQYSGARGCGRISPVSATWSTCHHRGGGRGQGRARRGEEDEQEGARPSPLPPPHQVIPKSRSHERPRPRRAAQPVWASGCGPWEEVRRLTAWLSSLGPVTLAGSPASALGTGSRVPGDLRDEERWAGVLPFAESRLAA